LIQKLGPLVFVVADTGSENPWQRSELQIYDYSIASRGALRVRQPVPLHVLDLQVQPLDDKGEHLGVCLITTPGGLAFQLRPPVLCGGNPGFAARPSRRPEAHGRRHADPAADGIVSGTDALAG